jgi:hypothetical protein
VERAVEVAREGALPLAWAEGEVTMRVQVTLAAFVGLLFDRCGVRPATAAEAAEPLPRLPTLADGSRLTGS